MNKNEFMEELKARLSKLSNEDREDAINYYWEYFEEAGFGEEGDVTKSVGNPEDIADKIMEGYVQEPESVQESESVKFEEDKTERTVEDNSRNTALVALDTEDLSLFDSIDIELASLDVIIRTGDEFGINLNCKDNEPVIERKGNCLVIRDRHKGSFAKVKFNFNIFNKEKDFVEITIPRNKVLTEIISEMDMGKLSLFAVSANMLKLGAGMGAISLVGVSSSTAMIDADTGHISIKEGRFKRLNVDNDTGAVNISGLESGDVKVDTDTGYISLERAKIDNAKLDSDTGYIKVSDAKISRLKANTDTGLIKLDRVDADYVEAMSDTGSINAKFIGNKDDYSIELDNDLGVILVDGKNNGKSIFNNSYRQHRGDREVKIQVDTGTIGVSFLGR